jgi:polyhydroxybutyrate depolymerase
MNRLFPLLLAVASCRAPITGGDGGADDASSDRDLAVGNAARDLAARDGAPQNPLFQSRPYTAHVPPGYDAQKPTPLVVMLHGYQSDGPGHEAWFKLTPVADAHGFLYAYPDGTKDSIGLRFWNATDACCNLFGSKVDDVAYLAAVVDDMSARYSVDPKRVFFVGHSNGAFMSHRLACDLAPRIAAIVAVDGDAWKDTAKCQPEDKVAVLQIHGDNDQLVKYGGGQTIGQGAYPSAADSVAGWARSNGCGTTPDGNLPPVDIDADIAGSETTIARYPCPNGGAAELWTVKGGPHQPSLATGAPERMWGFLSAHPKP